MLLNAVLSVPPVCQSKHIVHQVTSTLVNKQRKIVEVEMITQGKTFGDIAGCTMLTKGSGNSELRTFIYYVDIKTKKLVLLSLYNF